MYRGVTTRSVSLLVMPVNPASLQNLRREALPVGMTSEVHRVRAPAAVQDWFKAMSAEERGDLLARVMLSAPAAAKASSSPDLDGVTVLKVVSSEIPQRLKNDLRWSPVRYVDLETVLASTSRVTLVRTNGKRSWRTDSGATMRRETVQRLADAGVLKIQ